MAPGVSGIILIGVVCVGIVLHFFRIALKLRHIPGPFATSFTNLWALVHQHSNPILPTLLDLHQKYGEVVRLGPNRISVSSAESVKIIYTSHGEFPKADSYAPMRVLVNGRVVGSVIDLQDEEQSRALKRTVGGSFTPASLEEYEDDVNSTLSALVNRITEHPSFALYENLQFYQLDFLLKFAFNETPGHLSTGKDVLGLAQQLYLRVQHWVAWQAAPSLEHFIWKHPIWGKWFTRPSNWARIGAQRLQGRLKAPTDSGSKHPDLLQKCIDASNKHPDILRPETISSLVNSIISAGADTTAATLTTTIYYLMKQPSTLKRLREELEKAKTKSPPVYADTRTLPYLDAVLKEGLRLNPVLPLPLERVVPKEGCVIGGYNIPGGTMIGCMPKVVHLDKSCYGEDAASFRPERWLEASKEELAAMQRGFMSYGSGSHICLGRHIADMEMKKVLPMLVMNFEMFLDDPELIMPFEMGMCDSGTRPIKVTFRPRNNS